VIDLLELSAEIRATDADAAAAARAHARPERGRLAELAEWLAATTGSWPPRPGKRLRMVTIGAADPRVAELAATADVGLRSLPLPASCADAHAAGVAAADQEIDEGADLVLLAARDDTPAPAVAVALLTGAEPVALLPRGAAATDSGAWIAEAIRLRDTRRRVAGLRNAPGELLATLDSPALAAATGFALRTVGRRTPLLLDGTAAVAAALFCYEVQPRAKNWWLVADTSTDPIHRRAVEHLMHRPVLDLQAGNGDGSAALLALAALRTAATLTDTEDADE
jgi:nicotinate-nucleotide--dimethylbenzimidazole phosphoribosyltransferase